MIRFVVETVSSKTDINGNRYHYAIITSTKTGNRFFIKSCGGPDNATYHIRKVAEWNEIYASDKSYPIRQFNIYAKYITEDSKAHYEHEITPEMILGLETE